MSHTTLKIDEQILQIDQLICKNIDTLGSSERGFVSQNILAQLRNLVEHVMLKAWKSPNDIEDSYENICKAIDHTKSRGDLKFLRRFHDYLQIVASHYTLDEENSERLMLKYYEFLLRLKIFLRQRHNLDILQNIDKFPINTDPGIRHSGRKILELHGHLYISEYEENTLAALRQLKMLSASGISNYQASVDYWISTNVHIIDCEEKKKAIRDMFVCSKVALIYGPAGTGKSTLINHVSHHFANNPKIYLANTNPAIDNLRRKVNAPNCRFYTIAKFLNNQSINRNCDILIIDECSTVSNKDIKSILEIASFKLLVLVGDIYQIESIRFGNWFGAAQSFIPKTSIFELKTPYRSQNKGLLDLWRKVRECEDTIIEHIAKNDYSRNLDASIFDHARSEEIILCLNYDGLYGINNINRLLQESNPNPTIKWGIHNYKVNDPVLFNESNRFYPLIYNNMKGRIVQQQVIHETNEIQFDIEPMSSRMSAS